MLPRTNFPFVVKVWLWLGVFLVFMQMVIGGVTRLTGSGLSITKWEIVMGTVPPMNAAQWHEAFELYQATPQYKKINEGMSLSQFQFIYFWEYLHRLWARMMGLVFVFPFIYFLVKKWLPHWLVRRLMVVIGLAALAASFGWIMVASGLVDRPWVNAYKLTLHLSIALILYGYLFWTALMASFPRPHNLPVTPKRIRYFPQVLFILLAVQLVFGGIMSGMKAGLYYPTWPSMHGSFIPQEVLNLSNWNYQNFVQYDSTSFMAAWIQTFHRLTAYLLVIIFSFYFFKKREYAPSATHKNALWMVAVSLCIQVMLGIFTVLNSKGAVPIALGELHQIGAIILLSTLLWLNYIIKIPYARIQVAEEGADIS